jgi:hypothetical protein
MCFTLRGGRVAHARVHHSALQFFRIRMPSSWVPGCLATRGISPAIQDHWLAGYAPANWDADPPPADRRILRLAY